MDWLTPFGRHYQIHPFRSILNGVKPKRDRRTQTLEEAWIGDAVLTLYARLRILREDQRSTATSRGG